MWNRPTIIHDHRWSSFACLKAHHAPLMILCGDTSTSGTYWRLSKCRKKRDQKTNDATINQRFLTILINSLSTKNRAMKIGGYSPWKPTIGRQAPAFSVDGRRRQSNDVRGRGIHGSCNGYLRLLDVAICIHLIFWTQDMSKVLIAQLVLQYIRSAQTPEMQACSPPKQCSDVQTLPQYPLSTCMCKVQLYFPAYSKTDCPCHDGLSLSTSFPSHCSIKRRIFPAYLHYAMQWWSKFTSDLEPNTYDWLVLLTRHVCLVM